MKLPKPSAPRASPPALQLQVAVAPGTSNPLRLPHLPAHRRAFRSSLRLSPAGAAAGASARAERARENPASVAHRLATLLGTAPRPPRARRPNLGVPCRPRAGESWPRRGRCSRAHTPAGIPSQDSGARARPHGEERNLPGWRRAGSRAKRRAADTLRSAPPAGTRGLCRKPTWPAQATSPPGQPIPRAEKPHWLRSFISGGATSFPLGLPISLAARFSAS